MVVLAIFEIEQKEKSTCDIIGVEVAGGYLMKLGKKNGNVISFVLLVAKLVQLKAEKGVGVGLHGGKKCTVFLVIFPPFS